LKWIHVISAIGLIGAAGYYTSAQSRRELDHLALLEAHLKRTDQSLDEMQATMRETIAKSALANASLFGLRATATGALQPEATQPVASGDNSVPDAGSASADPRATVTRQFDTDTRVTPWSRSAQPMVWEELGKARILSRDVQSVECRGTLCKVQISANDRTAALSTMGQVRSLLWPGPMVAFVRDEGGQPGLTLYLGQDDSVPPSDMRQPG